MKIPVPAIYFPVLALIMVCGRAPAGQPAPLKMPAIFSDHAVLQRSETVPVWGWAPSGSTVSVELGDVRTSAQTDPAGRWSAVLNLASVDAGPFQLRVKTDREELVIEDVLVGQVWLASGQSNMAWPLLNTLRGKEEAAASANDQIRQFIVASRAEPREVEDVVGKWLVAGPSTAGTFSAVAYYFAKTLHRELGGPVAIVNATWGASSIEAWTSAESLATVPFLAEAAEEQRRQAAEHPEAVRQYESALASWFEKTGRTDQRKIRGVEALPGEPGEWAEADFSSSGKTAPEPGAIWFRSRMVVSESGAGQGAFLHVRGLQGDEEVFMNGIRLHPRPGAPPRDGTVYRVPEKLLNAGDNALAVRMFSPVATPVLAGKDTTLSIRGAQHLSPSDWTSWREFSLPAPEPEVLASMPMAPVPLPTPNKRVSQLFNGMIRPLAPYALAGVIWYQGESNSSRAAEYRTAFPLLIRDWRSLWGRDDLPFYWCQLSAFRAKSPVPEESNWAELREAQSLALTLPHTGQAVTLDVGEAKDIHPREKETVGRRLSAIALSRLHGKAVPHGGPVFDSFAVDGDRAILRFSDTAGGLSAAPVGSEHLLTSMPLKQEPLVRNSPDSELEGFALRGADGTWHWANARIEGETVIVSSPAVSKPEAVRYAWADNPTANLVGKNGFPAAPFRTDHPPTQPANR